MALQTPSLSLYITNIESKVKKPELRSQLYALFTPYGRVIDVTAKKHDGGRGQAFVTFDDQASATSAMRGLTGESFYGKPLSITYSKKPSNATLSRLDPSASRDAAAIKAAKLVVSRAQGEYEQLEKEREDEEAGRGGGGGGAGAKRDLEDGEGGDASGRNTKKPKVEEDEAMEIEMDEDEDEGAAASSSGGVALLCSNLPPECNEMVLSALFGQYAGFTKASPLSSSTSLPSSHSKQNPGAKSFRVTFGSKAEAEAALQPTKGYLMQPGWEMNVSLES
ncbi:hypothetical protein BD324DRAFT_614682 [Kockovaella imperatae]|uniref:RRM domain-containing protein n=1 Tax=Kockovaella imperatae TaxID=4999 RepID=A0A1Y1UQ64_9TREE|nr:hypothetical protein BD324DRAFT_614682 [Kockovaella imperatae]ORX39707.1 hypothetical protein BD324DRAFT_614682 [Kockovaella imperatae]